MISAAGLVLIYRNAEDDERAWLSGAAGSLFQIDAGAKRSRAAFLVRLAVGVALLGLGVFVLDQRGPRPSTLGRSKGRCS